MSLPSATAPDTVIVPSHRRLDMNAAAFIDNKFAHYQYLRDHLPVHRAKILGVKFFVCARYEDCLFVLKDDRFGRNRAKITGGRRTPVPLPQRVRFLAESMIVEDDPEHKRLRGLVQKAFAPKSLAYLEKGIVKRAHQLLDKCLLMSTRDGQVDFQKHFALPLPTGVIADMMGVPHSEMPDFQSGLTALTRGMSGFNVVRTLAWDLGKMVKLVRVLIAAKRDNPGEDILTQLIAAEEAGDRLSENELISMVFLLIIAGYETTVHLITNGLLALLDHPDALQELNASPNAMSRAVEEMLRYAGPIHGTKMNYARQSIELRGVHIPKGSAVMPLLASANRDAAIFTDPDVFDIHRDPNKHLAFSQGTHFCLGAFLARMETRLAFTSLLERCRKIELAVPRDALTVQRVPGWHRYQGLPVRMR